MLGSLYVKDDRTSLEFIVKVDMNVVRDSDLANITGPKCEGDPQSAPDEQLQILDPGYENTAVMPSSVNFLFVSISCYL